MNVDWEQLQSLPQWKTGEDSPHLGWELRTALDFGFAPFITKLVPKKPVLIYVLKGAPILTASFTAVFLNNNHPVTILLEDEHDALALEDILHKRDNEEDVFRNINVVLGTPKALISTDAGVYGGCVVLAYGAPAREANKRGHAPHICGLPRHISRLCCWDAHLLYVDQPCLGAPADVHEAAATDLDTYKSYISNMLEDITGLVISDFMQYRRKVTLECANALGAGERMAVSYYFRISRTSSRARQMCRAFKAALIFEEKKAFELYKDSAFSKFNTFVSQDFFEDWSKRMRGAEEQEKAREKPEEAATATSEVAVESGEKS